MATRMLIDARHREETRVAVTQGNRIEEFDFESAEHKQLKGNIYLARVVRVEPSLQAAFVEFGGNRHGFLAFAEIHPDYYQIPREDREALLAEEAEHAAEAARLEDEHAESGAEDVGDEDRDDAAPPEPDTQHAHQDEDDAKSAALSDRRESVRRRYRIQDVIKRRQVMLVQVVKEERGNKGAALTTYLSLAGRYTVLMPNTSKGGGISRKISSAADRKRLKSIMAEFALPKSMGLIVRTAGLSRARAEIRRDFDYLARLWDGIREATLSANAPQQIYADSDLLKRAIRDIYNKDVEEVLVEGPEGYTQAKEYMKLLMPSHARRVKHYADPVPLFQRNGVEDQLSAMFSPTVQLPSGGYLVINPTEALVSIDINSGRSTKEHGIEATALKTNLEAASEIARQLRLRDMAGLVVIDFIDMESNSNNKKVERCLKDALTDDRARIQVGRISSFGLLEMSRQRLRTGVLEASTRQCPHCEGTGLMRTAASSGLSALRMLEEEAARGRGSQLTLRAGLEAAFYVLNSKRDDLKMVEDRYGVDIEVMGVATLEGAQMEVVSDGPPPTGPRVAVDAPVIEDDDDDLPDDEIDEAEAAELAEIAAARAAESGRDDRGGRSERGERGERGGKARGRRRRRRGGEREDGAADAPVDADTDNGTSGSAEADDASSTEDATADGEGNRRRRGRRGGRRRRGGEGEGAPTDVAPTDVAPTDVDTTDGEADGTDSVLSPSAIAATADEPALMEPGQEAGVAEDPKPRRRRRKPTDATPEAEPVQEEPTASGPTEPEPAATVPDADPPKPRRGRRATASEAVAEPAAEDAPKRRARRTSAATTEAAGQAAEASDAEAKAEAPTEALAEVATTRPRRRSRAAKPADGGGRGPDTTANPIEAPGGQDKPGAPMAEADGAANEAADAVLQAAAPQGDPSAGGGAERKGWWQRTFG